MNKPYDNKGNTDVQNLKGVYDLLNSNRSSFNDFVAEGLKIQTGWIFSYNLDPVYVRPVTSNGGTVTHEGSFAKLSTGTDVNGFAEIITGRALVYTPGIGAVARFTCVFDDPEENLTQRIGIGNGTDGWFFGYNGLKFGAMRLSGGIENWDYQTDWNVDKRECLIPQKGNVYQIDFQWLGFGAQYFSIENKDGNMAPVHNILYSNRFTDVSIQNPSLPLSARIYKTNGSATDKILKTPSGMAGSYGEIDSSAFEFPLGFDQLEKNTVAGIETYLFTINNPDTFLSVANRLYILPTILSLASDGTKPVVIRVYFDAILTGASFIDVATGISPMQYDDSATAFTGGIPVFTTTLGAVDRATTDLSNIRGYISPGSSFTITALSKNASSITTGLTVKSRV